MCKANYYSYFYVKKYLTTTRVSLCNYEISIHLDFKRLVFNGHQ